MKKIRTVDSKQTKLTLHLDPTFKVLDERKLGLVLGGGSKPIAYSGSIVEL